MIDILPADLRHYVTFVRKTEGRDEDGAVIDTLTTLYTVRAKVVNLVGKEYFYETTSENKEIVKLWFRYRRDIPTARDQFIFNNRTYNIIYANDVENRNRYIEVRGEIYDDSSN